DGAAVGRTRVDGAAVPPCCATGPRRAGTAAATAHSGRSTAARRAAAARGATAAGSAAGTRGTAPGYIGPGLVRVRGVRAARERPQPVVVGLSRARGAVVIARGPRPESRQLGEGAGGLSLQLQSGGVAGVVPPGDVHIGVDRI